MALGQIFTIFSHSSRITLDLWFSLFWDVTPNALGSCRTGWLGAFSRWRRHMALQTHGGTSTLGRELSHMFVPQTALEHGLTDGFYHWTCCTLRSSKRYGRGCHETTWESRCGYRLPRTHAEALHPGHSPCSFWMTAIMPRS